MEALLKYAAGDDGQEYWFILRYSIERDGLSSYLIGLVYSNYFSLIPRMSQALEVFAQRQMIIGCASDNNLVLWAKFCEQTAEISAEAQVYMNFWQYDFFHEANKKLSEEAIISFIERGNDEMVKRIFKYEQDNGVINDVIVTLINANPKYLNWLLDYR